MNMTVLILICNSFMKKLRELTYWERRADRDLRTNETPIMTSEQSKDNADLEELESACSESENAEESSVAPMECKARSECRARTRTEKGLHYNLEIAVKKKDNAMSALRSRMYNADMMLTNSEDIVKLTAGQDGLEAEMKTFKTLHENVIDLLIKLDLKESQQTEIEDYTSLYDAYLECLADVKMRIKDQEMECAELLSHRSSRSKKSLSSARTSSTSSSKPRVRQTPR